MAILPTLVRAEKKTGIKELVAAIERRCDELALARPWSIAELKLDDEDYARLGAWAKSLDSPTVRDWTANQWYYWATPSASSTASARSGPGFPIAAGPAGRPR